MSLHTEVEERRCMNCTDVIFSVYVECIECLEHPVDLCLSCFSLGAECGTHRRDHSTRTQHPGGRAIFGTDLPNCWSASEEIALVEATEKFNLGNWEDVTAIVNPRRSVDEVQQHYDRYYLRGRIGQVANRNFVRPTVTDHTLAQSPPISVPLLSPPIRDSVHKISYDDLRILAYMPHRDDFEKEWKNDAEELVSKLLPAPDDDQLDKAVKLAHVDMYIRIVAKRRKRKALVRDYDLVPAFFKQEKPGLSSKAWQYTPQQYQKIRRENELRDQLKKFAQLMPTADFEQLVDGLSKQDLLKERIEELQKLRKNGVTTLEKPTTDGIDSEGGKRNWPNKRHLLTTDEFTYCATNCIDWNDYLLIKMSILNDEQQKLLGQAQRTPVLKEAVDLRTIVRNHMQKGGLLPCF